MKNVFKNHNKNIFSSQTKKKKKWKQSHSYFGLSKIKEKSLINSKPREKDVFLCKIYQCLWNERHSWTFGYRMADMQTVQHTHKHIWCDEDRSPLNSLFVSRQEILWQKTERNCDSFPSNLRRFVTQSMPRCNKMHGIVGNNEYLCRTHTRTGGRCCFCELRSEKVIGCIQMISLNNDFILIMEILINYFFLFFANMTTLRTFGNYSIILIYFSDNHKSKFRNYAPNINENHTHTSLTTHENDKQKILKS